MPDKWSPPSYARSARSSKVEDDEDRDDRDDKSWEPPSYAKTRVADVEEESPEEEEDSFLGKAWNFASSPLTTIPSEIASHLADKFDPRTGSEYTPVRSFLAGALEGAGDVVSSMTSPIDLAATALGIGGAKTGIRGLTTASKALSVPVAGHGAYEVLRPDATLAERGMGLIELAGGAAGTLQPYPEIKPRPRAREPRIPEPNVIDFPEPIIRPDADLRSIAEQEFELMRAKQSGTGPREVPDNPVARELELERLQLEDEYQAAPRELREELHPTEYGPLQSMDELLESKGIKKKVRPELELARRPAPEEEIPGLAELESSLGDATILDRSDDITDINASGDSSASAEALSRNRGMIDRGEKFVVYDKAGNRRDLIGPDAVDYVVKPGEAYGVEGPSGFELRDLGRGGRIPEAKSVSDVVPEITPEAPKPKIYTIDNAPPNQRAIIRRGAHEPVNVLFKDPESREVFGAGQRMFGRDGTPKPGVGERFTSAAKRIEEQLGLDPVEARRAVHDYNTEVRNLAKAVDKTGGNIEAPSLTEFIEARKAQPRTLENSAQSAVERLKARGAFSGTKTKPSSVTERLSSEAGALNLERGLQPDDLHDLSLVGAQKMVSMKDYNDWSRQMVDDFGDDIRPYLRQVFKESHVRTKEFGPEAPINPVPGAVDKLLKSMQASKGLRTKQDSLIRTERAKRFAAFEGVESEGMAGASQSMGKLKGEHTDINRSALDISQGEADSLFTAIKRSQLKTTEKARAYTALFKIMEGGAVPQRNELLLLNDVFGQGFAEQAIRYSGGLGALAGLKLNKTANTMKAMMSSIDLSGPMRQGIGLIHTPQWRSSFVDMLKFLGNKQYFNDTMQALRERPNFDLGNESGLFLSKADSILAGEEAFMSNYLGKLPAAMRMPFEASERAYVGFLNKLRADVFDDMVKKAEAMGHRVYELDEEGNKIPTQVADNLAKFINNSTGRGTLGRLEKVAPELNTVLWSPRLISSRLTTLNPKYYADLDPFSRREAIKSLLAIASTGTALLGLGATMGAQMNANPLSTDFGKARFGNKVLDPWGGYQQYIVAASRFIAGQNEMRDQPRLTAPGRLIENKLSPIASFAYDVLTAKEIDKKGQMTDRFGNETSVPKEALERVTPMFVQDVIETLSSDEDFAESIGLSLPTLLGVGVQDYPEARSN